LHAGVFVAAVIAVQFIFSSSSSTTTTYRAHRERIAAAERFMMPSLALLYRSVCSSWQGWYLPVFPYTWGWAGLLYLSTVRCVRWRLHLALLIPEACITASSAVAASLCLDGHLSPQAASVVVLQVSLCTV
jgi:hypothetical protein